jgi:hypothetical protein
MTPWSPEGIQILGCPIAVAVSQPFLRPRKWSRSRRRCVPASCRARSIRMTTAQCERLTCRGRRTWRQVECDQTPGGPPSVRLAFCQGLARYGRHAIPWRYFALGARGERPVAFGERGISAQSVAPRWNMGGILAWRVLFARRFARLGATWDVRHGLLARVAPLLRGGVEWQCGNAVNHRHDRPRCGSCVVRFQVSSAYVTSVHSVVAIQRRK